MLYSIYQTPYLEHHGVKGQKWGVRRYQNYDGTRIKSSSSGYKVTYSSSNKNNKVSKISGNKEIKIQHKELVKQLEDAKRNGEYKKVKQIEQKIRDLNYDMKSEYAKNIAAGVIVAAAGIGITAAAAAATGSIYLYPIMASVSGLSMSSLYTKKLLSGIGAEKQAKKYDDEIENNPNKKDKNGFKKKNKEYTVKEDIKRVNPHFKNFDSNTKSNCMLCTAAYDLRRRGYDVQVNRANEGYLESDIKNWYKDAKVNSISRSVLSVKTASNIKKELGSQGPGARGNIMVRWQNGGGHSMIYEVENNGKVVIRDAQTNQSKVSLSSIVNSTIGDITYSRLDNLKLNNNIKEVAHS